MLIKMVKSFHSRLTSLAGNWIAHSSGWHTLEVGIFQHTWKVDKGKVISIYVVDEKNISKQTGCLYKTTSAIQFAWFQALASPFYFTPVKQLISIRNLDIYWEDFSPTYFGRKV